MRPVPGAPGPAGSAPQRLAQMRGMVRQFSARTVGERPQSKPEDLRILTTPIYRFESTDPDVQDGGLFALVNSSGTDPEMMLLLESRKLGDGFAWTFGAARYSALEISLKHDGREVWNSATAPPARRTRAASGGGGSSRIGSSPRSTPARPGGRRDPQGGGEVDRCDLRPSRSS